MSHFPLRHRLKPVTNRERMTKMHLTNPSCAGCHVLIDPIGFGLERFDTMGQWHAKQPVMIFPTKDQRFEAKPQEFELELDTSASIRGIPDSEFSSAKALGRVLANDPTCQKCVVRQWFRFALGRRDTEADRIDVDRVFAAFRQSESRFQEMMIALVKTEVFRGSGRPQRTRDENKNALAPHFSAGSGDFRFRRSPGFAAAGRHVQFARNRVPAGSAISSRFMLWFNGNGIPEQFWIPFETGAGFEITPCLAPACAVSPPHTRHFGLDNPNARVAGTGNEHMRSMSALVTGERFTGIGAGGLPSTR